MANIISCPLWHYFTKFMRAEGENSLSEECMLSLLNYFLILFIYNIERAFHGKTLFLITQHFKIIHFRAAFTIPWCCNVFAHSYHTIRIWHRHMPNWKVCIDMERVWEWGVISNMDNHRAVAGVWFLDQRLLGGIQATNSTSIFHFVHK